MMSFDFSGKRVLVTGAGRGLGRHLSTSIARAGGEVYALGRNKDDLASLAAECELIHPVVADLSNWEETKEAVSKLDVMHGVVNNAATSNPWTPALEVPRVMIERTLNVNLLAAINVIQIAGKKMVDVGVHGSFVNVSSFLGNRPVRNAMSYNLSKASLDMVTKQFALELGPHQIRVNSVSPTVFLTDMGEENWSESERGEQLKSMTPLGRFAKIDEVVGPIMYLLSEHSAMVNGTNHAIDGGLVSNIPV